MHLATLELSGLRNLKAGKLSFSPSLNLIVGENGSGKTSLLEAIYLLGRGRSFRTNHLSSVINYKHHTCITSGLVSHQGQSIQIGVARQKVGGFQFKVNRQLATSSSQLAASLPLLLINSDSFSLLEGGPSERRQYLDWLLFHVEHSSRTLFQQFKRTLKQRNSLLRRGKIAGKELAYWDQEFVKQSEAMDAYRVKLFNQLLPELDRTMARLGGVPGVRCDYYKGWSEDASLLEQLEASRESEFKQGRTLYGAHRADIKIKLEGENAKEVVSRGQMKVLVTAMCLAQAKILRNSQGFTSLALIDDLPSELDLKHQQLVVSDLINTGAQVFLTAISLDGLLPFIKEKFDQVNVFHVEHGVIVNKQTGLS